ncbi:sirohydrochlorin chelatase [Microbacterium sp. MEC084]|uniref:sirohydrochlorin chelatase n=1 Tax=Microbacterium sp. MEC084 TaxID=1963027 RepID=UPI00106F778F|nr:CbiX/SirB N-terminal domain-containing protein [Microbacterium sp. MEC084]MCD1269112.1 sirohydrochlorin chelatase [Microbacterium sp. MEC084]
MTATPTLIACSHGTRFAEGRDAVHALIEQVRGLLPGVSVAEAFVDVQDPSIDDVVAATDGPAVIVPLLLSAGFHTGVDIARAAATRADVTATAPLGPHPLLAEVLSERLAESGLADGDHVVLAAAGSSRPEAATDVEAMRDLLAALLHRPVTVGYAAGADPRIPAAVDAARAAGAPRVVAASYVLAPGYFANLVADAGADVVTAPLAPDLRVAQVIAERYHEGVSALA